VNLERLTADIENGKFFHYENDERGNLVGTSYQSVDDVIDSGKVPILSIPLVSVRDRPQTILEFRKTIDHTDLQFHRLIESGHYRELRSVFMRPHEVAALEARLLERGTDSPAQIIDKLGRADDEVAFGKSQQGLGTFSKIIVNSIVETALGELKESALSW
jgi:guanylate kinase